MNALVVGLKEIAPRLNMLDRKVKRQVIRRSLRAGAKVTLGGARNTVPVRRGKLKKALKIVAGKGKRGTIVINVSAGAGWYLGDEYYGAFVEFGHKIGRRSLPNRKEVPGEHYMKHSYEETRGPAAATVTATMETELGTALAEVGAR